MPEEKDGNWPLMQDFFWMGIFLLETEGPRVQASPASVCCVLEQEHLSLLSTGSTQEDLSRRKWKIFDWDIKNQIKQTNQEWEILLYLYSC